MTTSAAPPSPRIPVFPPRWAEVFGEDDFGIFAEFRVKEVVFVWRWIPPGQFLMGSPDNEPGRWDDEGPRHRVTISRGFWFGETPVTQAQWQAITGANPSHFKGEQCPVEQVSWPDCQGFIRQLAEAQPHLHPMLPTEAQWEYACRAGTDSAFHDGSACTQPEGKDPALDVLGWYGKNSENKTHDVRQKRLNDWGLYDLHGNVWEWCRDAWDSGAYRKRVEGAADPEVKEMDESANRVVRGGSWVNRARGCRAAFRDWCEPGFLRYFLGLRLAAGQELERAEPKSAERPERR